jgi:hypothetical protein
MISNVIFHVAKRRFNAKWTSKRIISYRKLTLIGTLKILLNQRPLLHLNKRRTQMMNGPPLTLLPFIPWSRINLLRRFRPLIKNLPIFRFLRQSYIQIFV